MKSYVLFVSTLLFCTASLWASRRSDFSTWFAGDTGYNEVQFKQIFQRYGAIDVALIPIGPYSP
ncbi:MAG: hypothetical protein WBN96_10615, partial [Gammaproteobacteria bacterium]